MAMALSRMCLRTPDGSVSQLEGRRRNGPLPSFSVLEVVAMSQPNDLFNLKVHVRCPCGAVRKFCVPTDQQIPQATAVPTRPAGGGGGGGGVVRCPNNHPCGLGLSELRDRALRELERGRGEHIRSGAVVIEC